MKHGIYGAIEDCVVRIAVLNEQCARNGNPTPRVPFLDESGDYRPALDSRFKVRSTQAFIRRSRRGQHLRTLAYEELPRRGEKASIQLVDIDVFENGLQGNIGQHTDVVR